MAHRKAMADTKRVFEEMKSCKKEKRAPPPKMIRDWQAVVRAANAEISRMSKQMAASEERHNVEMSVISEEMHSELVDREANTARTAERFRMLQDRSGSNGNAYEKAISSSSVVESAIAQICCHSLNSSGGSVLLYEKSN